MVSGEKGNRNKTRKKEKLVIAKNPQQLAAGIIIFAIFLGKCGYDLFNYIRSQQPVIQTASQTETNMAKRQQEGLDSLSQDPTGANVQEDANDIYSKTLGLQGKNPETTVAGGPGAVAIGGPQGPNSAGGQVTPGAGGEDVEIMYSKGPRKKTGKTIKISVSDGGRVNPFLPEGENILPASLGTVSLSYPPEQVPTDSDASKVMETTISGILYDKYSPSAIIHIDGTDYLVKKGDKINNYRVLAILKEQVVVQLGKNIYKAGVGQLLQQDKVNYNTIANLEKKFGGNAVSINVKKKGY